MSQRDRVSAAAWLVVRDAHTAEDIFQNVALKAMSKPICLETDGALLSWAFITARREGIDWLRRRQHEPSVLDAEILDLLEREWLSEPSRVADARLEALRLCLNSMPEKSRRLLRLRYFEGYACKDVANKLGAGLDAIYKRLSRMHLGLKACIEQRLETAKGLDIANGLNGAGVSES